MSQTLERMSTPDAEFFYAEHHTCPMRQLAEVPGLSRRPDRGPA
jgi:hypothetical protein